MPALRVQIPQVHPTSGEDPEAPALISGLVGALRAEYIDGVDQGVQAFLNEHAPTWPAGSTFLDANFTVEMEAQVAESGRRPSGAAS